MTYAVVIHVAPKARSSGPSRCLDALNGVPLLLRTIARLDAGLPGLACIEVVLHDHDSPVAPIVEGAGYRTFTSPARDIGGALEEWAGSHPDIDAVLLLPEAAVFPDCVTTIQMIEALRDAGAAGADCVVAPHLPVGLVPVVIRTSGVSRLAASFRANGARHGRSDAYHPLHKFLTCAEPAPPDFRMISIAETADARARRRALPLASIVSDRHDHRAAELVLDEASSGRFDATDAAMFRRLCDRVTQERPVITAARATPSHARRVLFTSALSVFTGADQCLLTLMAGLDRRRFEPVLAVESRGVLADRARDCGIVVELADFDSGTLTPYNLRYWQTLLTDYDIDLVHANVYLNDAALVSAFAREIPIVGHARNVSAMPLRPIGQCASVMVAPSDRVAMSLEEGGYDPAKIARIYDGVDRSWFSPPVGGRAMARTALGLARDSFVLCMVTRIAPSKRQDLAIRALRGLIDRGIDAQLLLVGDPAPGSAAYAGELARLAGELEVTDRVRRLGFLTDARQAYAAADALVICLATEALGQCALEAAAMGVPAIVPRDTTGPAEVIRDGREGFHYTPNDAEELANRLAALRDPDLWAVMSSAARLRAEAFDLARHVRDIMQLYDQLLTQRAGQPAHSAH